MNAETFIRKWSANQRTEAAAAKSHFEDLCDLLDVPPPSEDATGEDYAFEKEVAKADGRKGFADVWRRGCFGWEYKSRGRNLGDAHDQLLRYAGALGNPPLLVASDLAAIVVRTNFTGIVTKEIPLGLDDLRDASTRDRLRTCWTNPEAWKPAETRQGVTERAAADFAELAQRLRERGHNAPSVAHFVNRLVFCLFAKDTRLLPADLWGKLLDLARRDASAFEGAAAELFRAMHKPGGRIGFDAVPWFNGGLFDDDRALPLTGDDVDLLVRATKQNWAEIDPSIFGTLFERGLNPKRQAQLGAHYTDRDKINLIVQAVVARPLETEWKQARAEIADAMAARARLVKEAQDSPIGAAPLLVLAESDGVNAATKAARRELQRAGDARSRRMAALLARAEGAYKGFLDRLRRFRVLDPACGSGNFLYLSLLALKDLELRASVDAEAHGLNPEPHSVGPEAVLGIELDPYAAELARVSVWIGHIQWARRNGYSPPRDPILRPLDTIECRDALLTTDGKQAPWPAAHAIVGNPPFLGGKRMRTVLGDTYCDRLFVAYQGSVPTEADLVCYWFARADQAVSAGPAERAGLVATNSIRGGANRRVLDGMADGGRIAAAWSDEPWVLDGAAVRVSLVCWGRERAAAPALNRARAAAIYADLTAGSADLTRAARLSENAGASFQGSKKVGPFEVPGEVARMWLSMPTNANGRPNADVLRPSWIGIDVARRDRDVWIIDFTGLTADQAAFYAAPYAHVLTHVKPLRDKNARDTRRARWWLHGDAQPRMRTAIKPLCRCIVTPEVSKHRVFAWAQRPVLPDCQLMVTAREDDVTFGVLQSRFHERWALALGTSLEDRPRYTPSTTFETFPFPTGLTPDRPASAYADAPCAQAIGSAARALVEARDRWLNPPELVDRVLEVVPGFPDRLLPKAGAEAALKARTLTALYNTRGTPAGAWLDNLHRALDAAVAAAYGWPADLPDADVLARLLALNLERAAAATA